MAVGKDVPASSPHRRAALEIRGRPAVAKISEFACELVVQHERGIRMGFSRSPAGDPCSEMSIKSTHVEIVHIVAGTCRIGRRVRGLKLP